VRIWGRNAKIETLEAGVVKVAVATEAAAEVAAVAVADPDDDVGPTILR